MIPSLLKGGFYHLGQVCISVQRIFAPKSKAKAIAQLLANGAVKLIVGNAIDESTECGHLFGLKKLTVLQLGLMKRWLQGQNLLRAVNDWVKPAPSVLLEPPIDAKVSTMEIFGPVVCVYGYDDIDQVIAQANWLEYAFQASVFTKNIDVAMKAIRELEATTVMVNDHTAF